MAAVSCNKEIETPAVPENNAPKTFVATVDGGQETKTVMGEIDETEGLATIYWNGTEQILIFGSNNSKKTYEAEVVGNQSAATFESVDDTEALTGDDYIAVYPALNDTFNASWAGTTSEPLKKLRLANIQNPVVDSFDPYAHLALATTTADDNTLEFKNVTAFIKFTVGNEKVTNPTFYGNNNEIISGNFDVVYNEGVPTVDVTAADYDYNYSASLLSSVEKDQTYYISIFPGEFEKGFTFEVEIEGNKYTKSTDKAVTIARNQILDLGVITVEPQTVTYKTVYFKPNDAWKTNNAYFAAWSWLDSSQGAWYDAVDSDNDGIYEIEVPETMANIIFASMSEGTTVDWDNKIYQTDDLTFDETKVCYVLDAKEWMTLDDAKEYVYVPDETPDETPDENISIWGLVGNFNSWNTDDTNYYMLIEGDFFVFRDFAPTMEGSTIEVKFVKIGKGWGDAIGKDGNEVPVNQVVDVYSGNAGNIKVPLGNTYDIYLHKNLNKAYFMTDGRTPYVDASSVVVGLSGGFGEEEGANWWSDPKDAYMATFTSKNLTDEAKYIGSYVYNLTNVEMKVNTAFKIRINGSWLGDTGAKVEGLALSNDTEDFTDNDFISDGNGTFNIMISFDWDGMFESNVKAVFTKVE